MAEPEGVLERMVQIERARHEYDANIEHQRESARAYVEVLEREVERVGMLLPRDAARLCTCPADGEPSDTCSIHGMLEVQP